MNTIAITTASTVTPLHPKPQTAATKATDRERGYRSQCSSPDRAVGAGTLRRTHRIFDSDGTLSQLQLWQHP